MTTEVVVAAPLPRPKFVGSKVTDAELMEAVRAWLYGETPDQVAVRLDCSIQQLHSLRQTGEWQELQRMFRDEFLNSTGGQITRIQQKILAKIEGYVDEGVKAYTMGGQEYTRQLSPKELTQIAAMIEAENKRIDKIAASDVSRKTFDAGLWRRKLEKIAEVAGERVA